VEDLVAAYRAFLDSGLSHGVFNMGGGSDFTMSLHELLDILKEQTGISPSISYSGWRPSDQKVYISDITKAKSELGWAPKVTPSEGVAKLVAWVTEHKALFA